MTPPAFSERLNGGSTRARERPYRLRPTAAGRRGEEEGSLPAGAGSNPNLRSCKGGVVRLARKGECGFVERRVVMW